MKGTYRRLVFCLCLILVGIAAGSGCTAVRRTAPPVEQTASIREIFARGAYCWFADPRAVRQVDPAGVQDKIYVGCIDTDGTVKALQVDVRTGAETVIVLDEGFQPDDHNNPTFLLLPDHRVMVFWSAHTAEPRFYYRVSRRPFDLRDMSERKVVSVEGFGNFTYPSPFYLTSAPESFYLCWRGAKWHPTIARYSLPDERGDIVNEQP
ncbi:MAG TPA: BNR-4 repeat-containing protein, partial [Candidatus Synoicihabitans sp.]|nr:BNR-4 repeat-containing protein [Candidatus Synoicihabitans sp.]